MARTRISDSDRWFELWQDDRECMLNTMIRNMTADLNAGYDYFGKCIINQRKEIEDYKKETESAFDLFKSMTEAQVSSWCFYDLKKRGVIE